LVASDSALAASSSTSVNVPGGAGVRTAVAAASEGNVAALATTSSAVRTGTSVKIPADPRAHLMFYLSCLSTVLVEFEDTVSGVLEPKYHSAIYSFTDYMNYKNLGTELSDQLLLLCDILKPGLFIDKCFFKDPKMCVDSVNEFYKIEEVEKYVAVNNQIMVKGENKAVKEVMFFKPEFLERNYVIPMKKLHYRLYQIQRGQHLLKYVLSRMNYNSNLNNCNQSDYTCTLFVYFRPSLSEMYNIHLILSMLFPLWVVVWVIMVILHCIFCWTMFVI
jgi:hypothetical protein